MRQLISAFILITLYTLNVSCNKEDDGQIPTCENCNFTCLDTNESDVITNNCINNWECIFRVTLQSKVDLSEDQGLASGDKNVFQMINSTEGDSGIADDEFTNILVFELDESQNSFSVEDNELEEMKVHYRSICFCGDVTFKAVTSGCIQGEKQSDGTWFLQGNLRVPYSFGNVDVKFDAQFVN